MSRSFNQNRFKSLIQGTHLFLSWFTLGLYILIGLLGIALIVFLVLPKGLLDFDLSNLENINIQFSNVIYEIDESIFSGVVNVKWLFVIGSLVGLVNIGFLQYILTLLRNVVRDVEAKQPFSEDNIKRLKWIGIAYLVAAVVLPFANSMFLLHVINLLDLFEANANFMIRFQSLFMGLIILILAYVFDYGAYLQEDHDMTV